MTLLVNLAVLSLGAGFGVFIGIALAMHGRDGKVADLENEIALLRFENEDLRGGLRE